MSQEPILAESPDRNTLYVYRGLSTEGVGGEHMYIYIYIYMCVCVCVYIYIYINIYVRTYIHTYIQTCAYLSICLLFGLVIRGYSCPRHLGTARKVAPPRTIAASR